ncbi:MAG: DUF2079 domain-containing protein [Candidatus Micrarchaeaceae archaeon]
MMMKNSSRSSSSRNDTLYVIIAVIVVLVSIIYWLVILTHAYNTFQDGSGDLTAYSYNMFFDIHYSSIVHGLQFFVISNHISPDFIFVLPFFYLYQHSIILVYIQAIVICLSSLIVFFTARRMAKDSFLALILEIAFLINPGTTGIITFDFHIEFLLVPLYLATFYFYIASNRKFFIISMALLLGSMEIAPVLGLTMALGLLLFEMYKADFRLASIDKVKKEMIAVLIVASIITGVFYYASIRYLISSYNTSYQQLPSSLEITSGSEVGLLSNINSIASNPLAHFAELLPVYEMPLVLIMFVLSIAVVLLGFGFFTFKKLQITLLFLLPWIIAVITWTDFPHFIYTGFQYYSYSLGSSFAASMVGLTFMHKWKGSKAGWIITCASILLVVVMLAMVSLILAPKPILFLTNLRNSVPVPGYNSTQIGQLMSIVPDNASLFTMNLISPHLAERKYMEYIPLNESNSTYFVPDYMLVVYSNNTDIYTNSSYMFLAYALENYNYTLYARESDARLYKRSDK